MFTFFYYFFFFFNDTATTEIYTLSLHDALPIYSLPRRSGRPPAGHRKWDGLSTTPTSHRGRESRPILPRVESAAIRPSAEGRWSIRRLPLLRPRRRGTCARRKRDLSPTTSRARSARALSRCPEKGRVSRFGSSHA